VLIEHGADVNAVGDMGETPLHIARHLGYRDIMRQLVEAGADATIRSEFGEKAGGD
jgi:ankyrin repeat protein